MKVDIFGFDERFSNFTAFDFVSEFIKILVSFPDFGHYQARIVHRPYGPRGPAPSGLSSFREAPRPPERRPKQHQHDSYSKILPAALEIV
jgi:hypothetical protein